MTAVILSRFTTSISTTLWQAAVIMSRHIPSTNMCLSAGYANIYRIVQLGRTFENRLHIYDASNLEMSAGMRRTT